MPLTVPVPETLVTEPLPLELKVFQSVEDKYPLVVLLAWLILIAGVVVQLVTLIGAVAVTDVTVPTFVEPPKLTAVPLIVIELLAN